MPVPETVLDCGANIGLTAAHYRALWPDARVVAVEMDGQNAEVARANLAEQDVPVVVCAVAAEAGSATYDRDCGEWGYRLAPGKHWTMCRTLTDLIETELGGCADFVKLDVEGAEWDVFEDDSWSGLVCHLLAELHPGGPADLPDDSVLLRDVALSRLRDLGFEARPHVTHPRAVWAWRP